MMDMIRYFCLTFLLLVLLAGCAPIEGLDGEEDNLPVMEEENSGEGDLEATEALEPLVEVTNDQVIPEEADDEIPVQANYIRVKADALNVRKDAGIEYDKLGKVHDGQIYEVLDTKTDSEGLPWYQLTTPEKITGWVSSEYCVPGETYESLMPVEE